MAYHIKCDLGERPMPVTLDAGERGQYLSENSRQLSEGPGWQLVGPPEGDGSQLIVGPPEGNGGVVSFGPPDGWGNLLTEQIKGKGSILH